MSYGILNSYICLFSPDLIYYNYDILIINDLYKKHCQYALSICIVNMYYHILTPNTTNENTTIIWNIAAHLARGVIGITSPYPTVEYTVAL